MRLLACVPSLLSLFAPGRITSTSGLHEETRCHRHGDTNDTSSVQEPSSSRDEGFLFVAMTKGFLS